MTPSMDTQPMPGIEKHYRVKEIVKILSLSDRSVRRLFADVPGVVMLPNVASRKKKKYETMMIPESVLKATLARLTRSREN